MKYFLLKTSDFPDPKDCPEMLNSLPEWRKKVILSYKRESDRKLSYGAWHLLEQILKDRQISPEKVWIEKGGKLKCNEICFNLSHSGNMALCAISKRPIGCDIEKVTEAPLEIAKRFFQESEYQYILSGKSKEDRNIRFFRLWTAKESYFKMTGQGLGNELKKLKIDPVSNTVFLNNIRQKCTLTTFLEKDYIVSICESDEI